MTTQTPTQPLHKPITPPTLDQQKGISGAFLAIEAANKILRLQPDVPKISVKGLENVNDALHTAQGHATNWADVVSAGVQNQLQSIVNYNTEYSALVTSINKGIAAIAAATDAKPPAAGVMSNLAAELQALQQQVAAMLYGAGGSLTNPTPTSALGVYNAISAYQQNVSNDGTAFSGFHQIAMSKKSGIGTDIQNMLDDIKADNAAIATDRMVIAGGAVAAIVGVLTICVGALLEIPTAGLSTGIIVGGAVVVAAGAGTAIYGAVDLSNKEKDITAKTLQLANDRAELAALTTIFNTSQTLTVLTDHIYGALDEIKTVWQQMDNNLSNVVQALNAPQADLKTWIKQQEPGQDPTYAVMATILNAQFVAPQNDWQAAEKTATTILDNFTNVIDLQPPANKGNHVPTYDEVAAYARSHQAT